MIFKNRATEAAASHNPGARSMDSVVKYAHQPHPVLARDRLAQVQHETLDRMIELHRSGLVPRDRLRSAGVPTLQTLQSEWQRRERARKAGAS